MIAVDTSALMAIVLLEPEARRCIDCVTVEAQVLVSAATVAEALIVAGRRGVAEEMARLIEGLGLEIVPVSGASARRSAAAYDRWGKGVHPAGLNFGDCFAYELAKARRCPLLFVGRDFSQTDVGFVP